jgi:hypothetical protein
MRTLLFSQGIITWGLELAAVLTGSRHVASFLPFYTRSFLVLYASDRLAIAALSRSCSFLVMLLKQSSLRYRTNVARFGLPASSFNHHHQQRTVIASSVLSSKLSSIVSHFARPRVAEHTVHALPEGIHIQYSSAQGFSNNSNILDLVLVGRPIANHHRTPTTRTLSGSDRAQCLITFSATTL